MALFTPMYTVPTEIFEKIIQNLGKKDLYTCLTVSKHFYSISIRCLFEEVCFTYQDKLTSFLDSFNLYPRSKRAGNYTRSFITSCDLSLFTEMHFIDILTLLPNIEELSIIATRKLIHMLTNTTKLILPKIKILHLYLSSKHYQEGVMDCWYRYRSSLTLLPEIPVYKVHEDYTVNDLTSYLASFPCLNTISIDAKDTSVGQTLELKDILQACPLLANLNYTSTSLLTDSTNPAIIQSFPHMTHLEIETDNMTQDNANYIKHSFPRLNFMKLTIDCKEEDEYNMVDTLLQMKIPDSFRISFIHSFNIDSVVHFVGQLNSKAIEMNENVLNKVNFLILGRRKCTTLSSEYNPSRRLRTITTCVCQVHDISKNFDLLDQIGGNLNILEMGNHSTDRVWNLEDFNRRCPMLSEMELRSFKLVAYGGPFTINSHLTTLNLFLCKITYSTLKQIAICYPMLQQLHLTIDLTNDNKMNKVHSIELPVTLLTIRHIEQVKLKWDRTVIKAVDGISVKSWRYSRRSKKMITSDDRKKMTDFGLLRRRPLYVFICNAVEEVILESL
ncbi:hypothetical protein BDB01DRAFT_852641 [Pilobolus umbonatus]|nr:hypothetical protein BDB01DRAFT_852641 [Pilobolus umbonatus]